ncbi:MAG: hypothetical protein HY059_12895 [Proteobacteria bacterium]|nr:hypothetical protein [Pseudomonadota bacterium]
MSGPPVAVASLDGTYRGEVIQRQRTGRVTPCPARTDLTVTLKQGEVRGEMTNAQSPGQPAGTFYAFVEADGRIRTTMRIGARTLALEGRFSGIDFRATAEGEECSLSASARRGDAG